jgi:hypothetical protein
MADLMQMWIAAMQSGRFEHAWAISDHVLRASDPAARDDPSLPYHRRWVWDGRPFEDRDVLVRCYHGLGDTIQFARYLPLLARRARTVTVEVQAELIDILSRNVGGADFVRFDRTAPLPPSECDLEIMELAFALRTRPEAVSPPYIRAAPATGAQGTIAICHTTGEWDAERRVPAELLRSICAAHPCISLVPARCSLDVLNEDGCTTDIAETASLIAAADLVITVDTMVAHLAGAMNKPTWVLLKAQPDWRWAAKGSFWYPSVRCYTQPRAGDWPSVLARVEQDLRAMRRENHAFPPPALVA